MSTQSKPYKASLLFAVSLIVLLTLSTAPLPAWAHQLQAYEAALNRTTFTATTQSTSIDEVRSLIEQLPATPDVTKEDGEFIRQTRSAYDALSEDERRLLDTETNRAALGTTQSYGRVLELAEAGYAVLFEVNNATSLTNGVYTSSVRSSWDRGKSASKQDRNWTATRVSVKDGKAYVTLTRRHSPRRTAGARSNSRFHSRPRTAHLKINTRDAVVH